ELILRKLNSYKLYDELNKHEVHSKYFHYCNYSKREFSKYDGIYQLCGRFARNLKEISTILNDTKDNIERCRYLNFWTNDQIRKMLYSQHNVQPDAMNSIVRRFSSVSNFVNKESSQNQCNYYYKRNISLDLWKKWKDLYDYIKNKNNIQNLMNSDNELWEVCPKYYSYIEGIYNNYKEECCQERSGNCPYSLDFQEWCNENDFLTKLECVQPTEIDKFPAGDANVIRAKRGAEIEEEKEEEGKNDAVISNSTGTLIGTFLGFVILLITIYRFTPLGSWINTKIFRKNKLMENMKRNERELLLNSSGKGEINFDNKSYHIMYNSDHNE
ncbi:CYIR protein, partial [Plasmodium cynomolgi strain B]